MSGIETIELGDLGVLSRWNESQDTQAVINRYHRQYGGGIMSTPPSPKPDYRGRSVAAPSTESAGYQIRRTDIYDLEDDCDEVRFDGYEYGEQDIDRGPLWRLSKDGTDTQPHNAQTRVDATPTRIPARSSTLTTTKKRGSAARFRVRPEHAEGDAATVPPAINLDESPQVEASVGGGADEVANLSTAERARASSAPQTRQCKMSCSQSTTQSNDGRSYDRHMLESADASLPSTAPANPISQAFDEQGTLHEDDTGAVKFNFSQLNSDMQPDPLSEPGFSEFKLGTDGMGHSAMPPPETPANPFAGASRSQLVPASELFRQTQFSSAVRRASPTSSRPSPDLFAAQNSISPNPISSPLKARGGPGPCATSPPAPISSPLPMPPPLPGLSSRPDGESTTPTPVGSSSSGELVVPESSQALPVAHGNTVPELIGQYEPMELSQRRRERSELRPDELGSESPGWSDDEELRRIQRVRSKRLNATKGLKAVTFTRRRKRDNEDEVEVPSTNKKARTRAPPTSEVRVSAKTKARSLAGRGADAKDSIAVVDSQERLSGSRLGSSRDAIPETSPPGSTRPRTLRKKHSASSAVSVQQSSLPDLHHDELETKSSPILDAPQASRRSLRKAPQLSISPSAEPDAEIRERPHKDPDSKLPAPHPSSQLSQPTSELSNLSATPVLSTDITPATESSVSNLNSEGLGAHTSSPANAKASRRRASERLPKLKITSGSKRVTRQRSRQSASPSASSSTDELARSDYTPRAATGMGQHNQRTSRLGRLSCVADNAASDEVAAPEQEPGGARGDKFFQGMVFAISFQAKGGRGGEGGVEYNGRTEQVDSLTEKIEQAGGRVLKSGFDELFEASSVRTASTSPIDATGRGSVPPSSEVSAESDADLKLTATAIQTVGFTALIADGHSRKTKYMQALALGLPCLSARWVTTCVDKGAVVDWAPYLLCAGQSAFLGDAIRSRNLSTYDATNPSAASLREVVARRPRLLRGSNILVVMKRSEETKNMAYVFLARALGAVLTRVHTVEEARSRLRAMEDLGRPYDWVYLDSRTEEAALFGDIIAGGSSGVNEGKRRRRGGTNTGATASAAAHVPPPKRIRTLSNELVIQSLILGRLIEADEMGTG